jgi:hypothetical protein
MMKLVRPLLQGACPAPRRVRRLAVSAAIVALAALGVPAVGTGFAQAAGRDADGALTFVPGKGLDTDPVYLVLPAPCPAAATSTIGTLTGKGFPADGINVVPTSPAGMRHDEAFGVPLQNALKNFAAMNGATFSGSYTFTVRCVDRLGSKTFATFLGTMTFSDPTHWTATKAATPPSHGVPIGILQWAYPELGLALPAVPAQPPTPGQAPAAGSPSGVVAPIPDQQPSAGSPLQPSARGQVPAASGASADAAVPGPADTGSVAAGGTSSGTSVLGVALGVLALLLGGAFVVAKRRERTAAATAARPTAKWPDKEHV